MSQHKTWVGLGRDTAKQCSCFTAILHKPASQLEQSVYPAASLPVKFAFTHMLPQIRAHMCRRVVSVRQRGEGVHITNVGKPASQV